MVKDTKWKVRRQFCTFSLRFFEPLQDIEKLHKNKQSPFFHGQQSEMAALKLVKMQSLKLALGINQKTKNVYSVLKEGFASGLFQILTDEHPLVVLEALNVMIEYYYAFRKKNFTDYFLPHFHRMVRNVSLKTSSF